MEILNTYGEYNSDITPVNYIYIRGLYVYMYTPESEEGREERQDQGRDTLDNNTPEVRHNQQVNINITHHRIPTLTCIISS